MRIFSILFLAMTVVFTGCKTHQVCDLRGAEICEIHHRVMQTQIVKNKKWQMPSQEYLAARSQGFIHSYPFFLPDECKECAVSICSDCVHAEQQWRMNHPQDAK